VGCERLQLFAILKRLKINSYLSKSKNYIVMSTLLELTEKIAKIEAKATKTSADNSNLLKFKKELDDLNQSPEMLAEFDKTGEPFVGIPDLKLLSFFVAPSPIPAGTYEGYWTGRTSVFEYEYKGKTLHNTQIEIECSTFKGDIKTKMVPCNNPEILAKLRKGIAVNFTCAEPTEGSKKGRTYTTVTEMAIGK